MGKFQIIASIILGVAIPAAAQEREYSDLDNPPHEYWTRELRDPFTLIKGDLESGKLALDTSGEKAFLVSLLKQLNIPVSSQLLVFSTTSLQLRLISPRNPRALYFNEDIYVGYIPGGKIEIVSLDPEVGGVFYIFDIPRGGGQPMAERSERCMNCHSDDDTRHVPGIAIKSVIPGPNGGSLESFRQEQAGHEIPFSERFGGWHLTGNPGIGENKANQIGRYVDGEIVTQTIEPGTQFDLSRYPASTSDILPHLLFEHQAGFMNRALEASYRARTYLHMGGGKFKPEHIEILRGVADDFVRYILFTDEAEFPRGGIRVDERCREDFLADRKKASIGISLKDLDLETRLFKHRCSYLIYSRVFQAIPDLFKQHIYRSLGEALSVEKPKPEFSYLAAYEKNAIRGILRETLTDLPEGW